MTRSVLVLSNHAADSSALPSSVRELLAAGRQLGAVRLVSFSPVSADLAAQCAADGVEEIFAPTEDMSALLSTPRVALVQAALEASGADLVLAPNDLETTEVLARLSIRLGSGIITDAVGIDEDLTVTKNVLGGAYNTTARVTVGTPLISFKPNSIDLAAAPVHQGAATVTVLDVAGEGPARITGTVEKPRSNRPKLEDAAVVVAAGRGINGDLAPIEALADVLDAAIGSSRAVTDAGWLEHSTQIGQTGKTVSPDLYVSVGISGALQQKTGMQTSKTIVAINKDADAPVFEIADFGVVGDLFEVIPQAVEEIKRRRGQ